MRLESACSGSSVLRSLFLGRATMIMCIWLRSSFHVNTMIVRKTAGKDGNRADRTSDIIEVWCSTGS